ncbi:hypothetical protein BpHYR1_046399 [Brachionus plicatilis]|uniref:Uncharacterized protein n=1 Tax=Brachionus plicatilis TaxID=10195 RepID=A0A3M7RHR4_BRAPC|nr:hypothetical protein BpHYR1_046399 [Brachionus plicatilis]
MVIHHNRMHKYLTLEAPSYDSIKHQKGSNDSYYTHFALQTPKSVRKRAQSLDDQENSSPKRIKYQIRLCNNNKTNLICTNCNESVCAQCTTERSHLTPFGASSANEVESLEDIWFDCKMASAAHLAYMKKYELNKMLQKGE